MASTERARVRMGMGMGEDEAQDIAMQLADHGERSRQMGEQLWLLAVMIEQRRRTDVAERPAFDRRANRVLARLDPC